MKTVFRALVNNSKNEKFRRNNKIRQKSLILIALKKQVHESRIKKEMAVEFWLKKERKKEVARLQAALGKLFVNMCKGQMLKQSRETAKQMHSQRILFTK